MEEGERVSISTGDISDEIEEVATGGDAGVATPSESATGGVGGAVADPHAGDTGDAPCAGLPPTSRPSTPSGVVKGKDEGRHLQGRWVSRVWRVVTSCAVSFFA